MQAMHPKPLLAFLHLEKSAGTILIHILRMNFLFENCDVRPLTAASARMFRAEDLQRTLRIYPRLGCIAGHPIKPFFDLEKACADIRYITVLRDPLRRYISQYQQWYEKMGKRMSFEGFLDTDEVENFQTKKIVGNDDIELAKRVLDERFMLVGIVEEFDEFLLLLRKKLAPQPFDPRYNARNTAIDKHLGGSLLDRYRDRIVQKNRLDIELYAHVRDVIRPRMRAWYGPELDADLERFRVTLSGVKQPFTLYLDYLFRKLYLQPATGMDRKLNGLPVRGSY